MYHIKAGTILLLWTHIGMAEAQGAALLDREDFDGCQVQLGGHLCQRHLVHPPAIPPTLCPDAHHS